MSDNNELNNIVPENSEAPLRPGSVEEILPEPVAPVEEAFIPETPKTEYIPSPAPVAPVVPDVAPAVPEAPAAPAFAPAEPAAPAAPVAPVAAAAAAAPSAADAKKAAKREAKAKKASDKLLKEQGLKDQCPSMYKPVSTSRYFWLIFLLAIPVVGFIATIILSFAHRNRNVKAFVRAILAWDAIIILLFLIGMLCATFLGYGDVVGKIALAFGEFFETLASAVNL